MPLSSRSAKTHNIESNTHFHLSDDQKTQKNELLKMIDILKKSLEKSWSFASKNKKKKLHELEEIKLKLEALDESQIELILIHNLMASNCLRLRPRINHNALKNQLSSSLKFIDGITSSIRSDVSTNGDDSDGSDLLVTIDFNDFNSINEANQEESGSKFKTLNTYESLLGRDCEITCDSETDSLSEGLLSKGSIDDISVMTSSLRSASSPLGLSITTWNRHSLKNKIREECEPDYNDGGSSGISHELDNAHEQDLFSDDGQLEEIAVTVGDTFVIHATRSSRQRIVRFAGIKPTLEENLDRAKQLLSKAKSVHEARLSENHIK